MTEEKKTTAKKTAPNPVDVAGALLAEAVSVLDGIGGKKADIWTTIAARVEAARLALEKHK